MLARALILFILLASCSAQETDELPFLKPTGTVQWTRTSFSGTGPAECDPSGNFYFHTDDIERNSILKLSPDGSSFEVLKSDGEGYEFWYTFRVFPDGVWVLLSDETGTTVLKRLRAGEAKPTTVRLDLPGRPQFQPENFLVFGNGNILVGGRYGEKAEESRRGKPFLKLFNASGQVVHSLDDSLRPDVITTGLPVGSSRIGSDGLGYFLGPNEVLIVNDRGEIHARHRFVRAEGFFPSKLELSDGLLVIHLAKKPAEIKSARKVALPFELRYLAMEAGTGRVIGQFRPTEEMGNNMMCFTRDAGFTFFRVGDGMRIKLVRAAFP